MQQMFDFQDEEGLATGIPKLIQFLKDNDTIVVQQASQVCNDIQALILGISISKHRFSDKVISFRHPYSATPMPVEEPVRVIIKTIWRELWKPLFYHWAVSNYKSMDC